MADTNDQVIGVEEYIAQREKEAAENGERSPRRPVNANYTSFVVNEVEDIDLEYTGKNEVKKIKLIDKEGNAVAYKTSIVDDDEYTYEVETYVEGDKDNLDKDKKKVLWRYWLPGIEGFDDKQARHISTVSQRSDNSKDFLSGHSNTATRVAAIKKNAILYAKKEVVEKDGKKVAILKIKYSKWLDGEKIRIQGYLNEKKASGPTVATRLLTASPEILEAYWLNASGRKLTYTGYKQDVYLYLKTLGLQGKTLETQVFDADLHPNPIFEIGTDDQVEWKNNKISIESREVTKQFKVGDKSRYNEAQQNEAAEEAPIIGLYNFNNKVTYDLELYIHIANSETLKIKHVKSKYGQLNLIPEEKIVNAFFAKTETEKVQADAPEVKDKKTKKTKLPPKAKVPYYKKLNNGVIGQKVQLVAECANLEGKEVVFKIYEKEKLLVAKDAALPVLQNNAEVTEIKATVQDGYAVAEVELQKVDKGKYKDWDIKLDPDTGDLKTSLLFVKVSCEGAELPIVDKLFMNRNSKEFSLNSATHLYEICSSGAITKYDRDGAKKGRYYYFDNSNTKHFLGRYIYKRIKNNYKSNKKYGLTDYISLVDLNEIKNYSKGALKFGFTMDSPRHYANEFTLASLFGAMLECGFDDFVCNGFSKLDGSSSPSVTHKNGFHGDFKYLRKDEVIKTGVGTSLNILNEPEKLDVTRQNKFNNALMKFGWKNLLGWSYTLKGKKYFLDHIPKESANHDHHLHIEIYNHNFISVKNE